MHSPQGFREFVNGRSGALIRSPWSLTGDWYAAEDLVQVALAKTWPHWDKLVRDGAPELYVRRTMVNTYATWWRRRWRHELATAEVPDSIDSQDPYARTDVEHLVAAALVGLPTRQRATVVLRYMDDLTEAETAHVMGCSVGTVKSQTAKALAHLRRFPGFAEVGLEMGNHDQL